MQRHYIVLTMAAKKRRAIPAEKPLKDQLIQIRISADEKQALADVAARDGLGLSAWLRRLALREAGLLPLTRG